LSIRINITLIFIISFSLLSINSQAEDFNPFGARSFAMGGVGVATNKGAKNIYWNPARLTIDKKINASLSLLNLDIQIVGSAVKLVDELKELPDIAALEASYKDGFDPLNPEHIKNAQLAFKLLFSDLIEFRGDDGILISENTGLSVQFNIRKISLGLAANVHVNFGVSAILDLDYGSLTLSDDFGLKNSLDELFPNPIHTIDNDISAGNKAAAQALLDTLNTSSIVTSVADTAALEEMLFQIDEAGVDLNESLVIDSITDIIEATQNITIGDADNNNQAQTFEDALANTGVFVRGIVLASTTLSYGRKINNLFAVGINLNLYQAKTFIKFFNIDAIEDYEIPGSYSDVLDTHENDIEESFNFGVDLGLNFSPIKGLSLGLVGKNLNQPKFDAKIGGDYKLYPQVRFGVGYQMKLGVLDFLVGADLDLLQNKTDAFPGTKYQQAAIGAEIRLLKFLFLRAGYNNNLAASEGSGGLYTAGVGLYFLGVRLDVAAGMGEDQLNVDGTDYPTRGGLAFELQYSRAF